MTATTHALRDHTPPARTARGRAVAEAHRLADATIALVNAQMRLLTDAQNVVYADRLAHHLRPDPAAIKRGVRP